MVSNHYPAFVEEAFIEPIRSVLIVDDDFPTYDEVLTTAGRSGTPTPRNRAKAWRRQPGRIVDLISTFRRRPRPLLVDIHDGANVSPRKQVATAAHLHQCDLLVLDYELDRTKPGDGTRAIEILRALMSNNHFNLVVIYTNEELELVYDAIRWGLISPSADSLTKNDVAEAKLLIENGEDSIENFQRQLHETIGSAQYFHSRQHSTTFLRTMGKSQQPYSSYRDQTDQVDWTSDQRKLVLRYLLKELEVKNGVSSGLPNRFGNLDWSARGLMWLKSDSAFVALSGKTANDDDLIADLRDALIHWNPRPSRLFLTKLRAEIDEYGVAAQGHALRNHHALAYWYYRLLVGGEKDDRRWRIAESVSRHATQLLEGVQPGVESFAVRLVESEVQLGEPLSICKDHFGIDLNNDEQRVKAILEHNAFVCSMDPTGWHLTTGHIFQMSDEHWLCLSPACDLVPSQMPSWQTDAFGERLPFVAIRLRKIRSTRIPKDVHSNRYVFVRVCDTVFAYCFNDPSDEGSTPRWQILFAENRGRFSAHKFQFKVTRFQGGKRQLLSRRFQAKVIGQVRYEYALNLIQKLGVSLTRVGLDFSGEVEG